MSKLNSFLNPVSLEEIREVVISKRFKNEDGTPVPFTIKSITQGKNREMVKACTASIRDRTGSVTEHFDTTRYSHKLALACVTEPDLYNEDLCNAYGTKDPEEVLDRMLLLGEYNRLMDEIRDINGFEEDIYDQAKNS